MRQWEVKDSLGDEELKRDLQQLESQGWTIFQVVMGLDDDYARHFTVICFKDA